MAERFVKSHIAERVAELIGAREGRRHLESHGWSHGMPIIMAQPHEPLDDVIGLVSMHEGPALIATLEPEIGTLRFIYVSRPTPALKDVEESCAGTEVWHLFENAAEEGTTTFKAKYNAHSAVAHIIPVFDPHAHVHEEIEGALDEDTQAGSLR